MSRNSWPLATGAVAFVLFGMIPEALSQQDKEPTLQDAIKARTEVMFLREEVGELDADVRGPMRKVITKGDAQQMAGNILLTKDKYAEAVEAYGKAAGFYRQAIHGRKILERLAEARKKASRARMLAEASADAEKLKAGRRLETNADGYEQAGEFESAIAELKKAQAAYEKLLAPGKPTTLEETVGARTAMLAARKQVRDLGRFRSLSTGRYRPGVKPEAERVKRDSLPDLIGRALRAEAAAADALQGREYTPARALFAQAEGLYRRAAGLQVKRDKVVASQKTAQDSMKLADAAFQTEGRPASFERGKQCLADGTKALVAEDLDKAREFFGNAVKFFATAQTEADVANAFAEAQNAWARAVAEADDALLAKHVAAAAAEAKGKAKLAEKKAREGQVEAGTELLKQAAAALKDAASKAVTAENAAEAAPIIARLERLVGNKKKFEAEDVLADLEKLIPSDPRMGPLRRRVAAIPGLKRRLSVDLGAGVKMDFVLIRPGSFKMGSEESDDEKPIHEVTITKPFYMGKYQVTQEQWQALMGSNPSNFKGKTNPVEQVSWDDCQGFLKKLKSKLTGLTPVLPTEAEWEYACRAGSTTKYCFGDEPKDLGDYAWYSGNSNDRTHPVGKKKPNAWGLYDMHGNVWEWCRDRYDKQYYAESPKKDPTGIGTGRSRVLRGGSWYGIGGASYCRSAARIRYAPDARHDNNGFRVVLRGGVD